MGKLWQLVPTLDLLLRREIEGPFAINRLHSQLRITPVRQNVELRS
jgi:hypothetical protein